jgi:hypothetical protein
MKLCFGEFIVDIPAGLLSPEDIEAVNSFTYKREDLEAAAEELTAMGLGRVADIVLEHATELAPKDQCNPFDPEIDGALPRDWNRRELGDYTGFMFSDDALLRAKRRG